LEAIGGVNTFSLSALLGLSLVTGGNRWRLRVIYPHSSPVFHENAIEINPAFTAYSSYTYYKPEGDTAYTRKCTDAVAARDLAHWNIGNNDFAAAAR
jgi:hypothetical protein